MGTLHQDSTGYFDDNGLVLVKPGQGTGNGLLFLAEWLILARVLGELGGDDKALAMAALQACDVEPGLYRRAPKGVWPWTDLEQQDDYIGVGAIAALAGFPSVAVEILAYGWKNLWVMNNSVPGALMDENRHFSMRPFLGRYPAMIAHLEFAAGLQPPLWRKLWWAFVVASSGSKEGTDPWKLSFLMVTTMAGKSRLCGLAAAIFQIRLKRAWGSMQAVYTAYFGPEHPIAKHCPY